MHRILIADDILPAGLARLLAAADAHSVYPADSESRADALDHLSEYDALIIRSGTPVTRALIERGAPRLKVIGRAGLALDNIDLAAATEHGVMVLHTPQAYALAAAEHTLALMLALCRHLPQAEASLRRGEWERGHFLGTQLHGKTLGLIGFGRVGQLVAVRALAFGMEVLAYNPYIDPEHTRQLGVTAATFDEVLTRADFISLHAALTPDTRGLIGAREIERMKPGARLINAARGALVDEAALCAALESGHLAGAALDVYTIEPPLDSPLLRLPTVVALPHIGASTVEAQHAVSIEIAEQVLAALRGADYRNVVNLPFIAVDFPKMRPYLELAEKLGALQGQLAGGRVQSVEVEVKGEGMAALVKPAAVAILKGLLGQTTAEPPNYINAPVLAAERGIAVSQTRGLPVPSYANLISCRVTWEGGQRLMAGTLFAGVESRLVQMDDFRMDAKPEGAVLVMFSRDVPGVIGKVGMLMQRLNINIAEWRLGRNQPGGTALSFINLDSPLSAEGVAALRALPEVLDARTVML